MERPAGNEERKLALALISPKLPKFLAMGGGVLAPPEIRSSLVTFPLRLEAGL